MKKDLLWWGPVFSYSGYAQHNRGIIFELLKHGWNIRIIATEKEVPTGLLGKEILLKLCDNTSVDPANSICINLVPPPACPQWGKYTILYTTLESTTIHQGFLMRSQQYDEIWVPCKDNYISFLKYGTKKMPIKIVPEGVNEILWHPDVMPDKRYKSPKFTFIFCGDWSYRKGNDTIITAFARAFAPGDPVRLLLFTHWQGHGPDVSYDRIKQEINWIKKQNNVSDMAECQIICEHVSDDELPGILKCGNVGLFPTRGEAWLLPTIQLMSMGVPVITSSWGGQSDYCNKSNSYMIKTKMFDTIDDKINCMVDFQQGQLFVFPDINHLIELMQLAYSNHDLLKQKSIKCVSDIRNNWTWTNAGNIANEYLTNIARKVYS